MLLCCVSLGYKRIMFLKGIMILFFVVAALMLGMLVRWHCRVDPPELGTRNAPLAALNEQHRSTFL